MKLKNLIWFLACLFSMGIQLEVHAQLYVRLGKDSIVIGDMIPIHIVYAGTLDVQTMEPLLDDWKSMNEKIEIRKELPLRKEENAGRFIYGRSILVSVFDTGRIVLPPIPVVFNSHDTLMTQEVYIPVHGVHMRAHDIQDIKPIIREPIKLIDFWWVLPLAIVSALILRFVFRKKKTEVEETTTGPAILLTPFQRARAQLDTLNEQNYLQQGKFKEQVIGMSSIFRQFLEATYHFPAEESTNMEIRRGLQKSDVKAAWVAQIQELLGNWDLVKFAKAQTDRDQIERDTSMMLAMMEAMETQQNKLKEEEE